MQKIFFGSFFSAPCKYRCGGWPRKRFEDESAFVLLVQDLACPEQVLATDDVANNGEKAGREKGEGDFFSPAGVVFDVRPILVLIGCVD